MRIVVKIGGSVIKNGIPESLIRDIKTIRSNEVVVVHGGGDIVTEIAEKLGKKQRFVISPEGIRSRYTDKETAEIYAMVMKGLVSNKIVIPLLMNGVNAIGLSGVDAGIIRAKRKTRLIVLDERGRKMLVEGGYTGKVTDVNSQVIEKVMNLGFLPVISPIAISDEFEILNIDGDRAASSIASSLRSDYVIFLTNVEGLYLDNKLVRKVNAEELKKRIGEIGHGMQKKVIAAIEAVENGVSYAVISSALVENPVSSALSFNGTVVVR